jgi:hypothetical protein
MTDHSPTPYYFGALFLALALSACGSQSKNPMAPATGDLQVDVGGLPVATSARVEVTGPGGFDRILTSSGLLGGLATGAYTVTASYVSGGGQLYYPSISNGTANVTSGNTWTATVSYAVGPTPTLNLQVAGVQLFQSVQRPDNSVPMVVNRDALLRVFVTASGANTMAPAVRVRLYSNGVLVDSVLVSAPSSSVPLSVDTTNMSTSWNAVIPAARMQPNLGILAEVDPANQVPELDKTDNRWPSSGTPFATQVLPVAALHMRFVPVRQGGITGNVTNANKEALLDLARRMYPLSAYDIDVRATYTSSSGPLMSNDSNGAWGAILTEVAALRASDASTRQYYGVVGTSYNSGYAGLGYIGSPVAIGWDKNGSAPTVVTHEIGHNFGRLHAPCGVTPADASYPYPNANIGVWGLDVGNLALKSPGGFKDIMSYCGPNWVSDYTYEGILNFRGAGPLIGTAAADQAGPGVLVWGRIRKGGLVLEPAFSVTAPPRLPSRAGSNRLVGLDASGATLFDLPFEGDIAPDLPGGPEEHFAFVIPLDQAAGLAEIRLLAGGRSVTRSLSPALAAPSGPAPLAASRVSAEEAEVRWDPRYPMALVRDAETGEILSFARGGLARVATRTGRIDVQLSTGVGSRAAVRVPIR